MTNFNRPYFSKNIQEFWKRWHISLSTWFRDYLYVSIGGNRVSKLKIYRNVAIVFIISGFWHGANWTFLIWGLVHSILIIAYMLYKEHVRPAKYQNWLTDILSIGLTFFVVCIAWVFFRAENLQEAMLIFNKMVHTNWSDFRLFYGSESQFGYTSLAIVIPMMGVLFINEKYQDVQHTALNKKPIADILFNSFLLFCIISFGVFQEMSFIYFQF